MGGFAYPNPNLFHNSYQDVDPAQAKIMAIVQKPFNTSIFTEKSGPPALEPTSDVVSSIRK